MKQTIVTGVLFLVAGAALPGCVGMPPTPPTPSLAEIPLMCVKTNDDANAPDFVADLRHSLERRGTNSVVYEAAPPTQCRFHMLYWTMYQMGPEPPELIAATVRVYDGNRQIGQSSFSNEDLSRRLYQRSNAEKADFLVAVMYQPGIPGTRSPN